jgi:hypothetical protein
MFTIHAPEKPPLLPDFYSQIRSFPHPFNAEAARGFSAPWVPGPPCLASPGKFPIYFSPKLPSLRASLLDTHPHKADARIWVSGEKAAEYAYFVVGNFGVLGLCHPPG